MNTAVLNELAALLKRDDQTRQRLLAEGSLYGRYDDAMQAVHRENAEALDAIAERHGWPGLSLVGLEGSRMAWRIAQHANVTPGLQRKFLALMRAAADKGDVPPKQPAFLADRVLFNEGKPQIHGVVLDWTADGELSCDLADPTGVDQRRAVLGLPPFQEDRQRQQEAVMAEGGRPPADFAAYRDRSRAWAEAVGWRPAR
ncbi:DUF6624 domain-containing protein [Azospirillum doebereinerae]|uniref:DUF6624 domain-containing protein n=1 Tax=Azospirillum doebereinerae TaxID=92933 RepID=UPI001EE5CBC1|nr:DUF6624 domain-containing protein [Azospirillum doebereinerae]MCG5239072.1 hypothetical protein [Azospirillum doebereinerae]